jgi:hypothetical protein
VSERTPWAERLPGVWTLVRDVLTFGGGWWVIFAEIARPEVRESVLLLAGSAIATPAAAQGLSSVAAAVTGRRSGTGGPPTPSPEVAPSPSPPL